MQLESIHVDPLASGRPHPDAHRIDLENAVLIQELMAMKVRTGWGEGGGGGRMLIHILSENHIVQCHHYLL